MGEARLRIDWNTSRLAVYRAAADTYEATFRADKHEIKPRDGAPIEGKDAVKEWLSATQQDMTRLVAGAGKERKVRFNYNGFEAQISTRVKLGGGTQDMPFADKARLLNAKQELARQGASDAVRALAQRVIDELEAKYKGHADPVEVTLEVVAPDDPSVTLASTLIHSGHSLAAAFGQLGRSIESRRDGSQRSVEQSRASVPGLEEAASHTWGKEAELAAARAELEEINKSLLGSANRNKPGSLAAPDTAAALQSAARALPTDDAIQESAQATLDARITPAARLAQVSHLMRASDTAGRRTILESARSFDSAIGLSFRSTIEILRTPQSAPPPASTDADAHQAATSPHNDLPQPTEGQKDAGNYKMGHTTIGGLDLTIENPAGSTRSGTGADGKPWSIQMKSHYGYLKGTQGKDGDHIDAFIKPGTPEDWNGPVYVVNQKRPDGSFDEHKAVIGVRTPEEARAEYLQNYEPGWKGLGSLAAFPGTQAFGRWASARRRIAAVKVDGTTPKQAPEPTKPPPAGEHAAFESWLAAQPMNRPLSWNSPGGISMDRGSLRTNRDVMGVTPDAIEPGKWRVTAFDGFSKRPLGHSTFDTRLEAARFAAESYGSRAQFAPGLLFSGERPGISPHIATEELAKKARGSILQGHGQQVDTGTAQGAALVAAESLLRESPSANTGHSRRESRDAAYREQRAILRRAARDVGLSGSVGVANEGEHRVRHDSESGRAHKATNNDRYGYILDQDEWADSRKLSLRPALPSEYLWRIGLQDIVFADDIRLTAVAGGSVPSIHTSQPWLDTNEPPPLASMSDVRSFMQDEGFLEIPPGIMNSGFPRQLAWYRPSDQVLVYDAKPGNFIKLPDGDIEPIDHTPSHPGSDARPGRVRRAGAEANS